MSRKNLLRFRAAFVTGAAGFIGSHLVERLLEAGVRVVGYDDLSTGMAEFLMDAKKYAAFTFIQGDTLDTAKLREAMAGADIVFHFAANADIRKGTDDPRRDLEQNTIATFNVLEAMRTEGVRKIAFASSSAVYGDAGVVPTPEDVPMPTQISLYGASKAAGEGLVAACCECFGFQSWIFRFVSVLGARYTHGHVFDFVKQLRHDPQNLVVLGDGRQRKSYMDVSDCIDAILLAVTAAQGKTNIFNLGLSDYVELNQSIAWITEQMGLKPALQYTGGERGWVGDSPFVWLDPARIMALGWKPKVSIEQAVRGTVDWLQENSWALRRK
jgi:UDP-glucose 4-epimerase